MIKIQGMPGSPGHGMGRVVRYRNQEISVCRQLVEEPEAEIAHLELARRQCSASLEHLLNRKQTNGETVAANILDAYLEILHDDAFFSQVANVVRQESVCAPWAIEQAMIQVEAAFSALDDPYLRERLTDINYVCSVLMSQLLSGKTETVSDWGQLPSDAVIFASDFSPVDTMRFDHRCLKAIVTERGGETSHTVILAKSLGIPAIVAAGPFPEALRDGQQVLVNANRGVAIVEPAPQMLRDFLGLMEQDFRWQERFAQHRLFPAVTQDGHSVQVCVNVGGQDSLAVLEPQECDGVGLFRTEFLYMDKSDYPTEEEQFQVYRQMAQQLGEKELVIRTLDIGGDKQLNYMQLPVEANPFLGLRAIRLCLERKEMFKTQLRAILRAAVYGNVKILFPMIVTLEELREAKALLLEAQTELEQQGLPHRSDIPVGVMIETPAAVLIADQLARHVSFFSIGSNDLIQYITTADRLNERVHYLYDVCNISVLRSLKMVCDCAASAGISICICGEAAATPNLVPLWCVLGISKLSVAPPLIGQTKYLISQFDISQIRHQILDLFRCDSATEVHTALNAILLSVDFPLH